MEAATPSAFERISATVDWHPLRGPQPPSVPSHRVRVDDRVGEYGGYMIVETHQPTDIHYVTSVFAVFEFKVELVVDVMDAVAVEVQAIEYRKKTFPKRQAD